MYTLFQDLERIGQSALLCWNNLLQLNNNSFPDVAIFVARRLPCLIFFTTSIETYFFWTVNLETFFLGVMMIAYMDEL